MRIAIYARISTKHTHQDLDTQLGLLRKYAASKPQIEGELPVEYLDTASGSRESRPGLDALMKDARRGLFDVVVVQRFDRFARSIKHLVTALEEFNTLGIEFVSLNEAIDTRTPLGKAMFTIIGAIAELERNIIRERVMAGLERAKREGKTLGRQERVFDREYAKKLKASGMSLRQIESGLGVSRETIRKALR